MSIEKNAASTAAPLLRAAAVAIGLLCAASASAQNPGGCSTPSSPGTAVPLALDSAVVSSKGTDEWNSEVIKITVYEPALLTVSAEGPEAQGLLYTPDSNGGAPQLLGTRGIGTAGRILARLVEPGEYCVRVLPPSGASGSLRVQAELIGLVSIPQ